MKHLSKKSIVLAMALIMLFQTVGTVTAASVDWESGGYYYSAYVNKGSSRTSDVILSETAKKHTQGTNTNLTIAIGRTVTITSTESFPSPYSTYLYSCMASEGLQTTNTVTFNAGRTIVVPAAMASGTYAAVQRFYGYTGAWGILRSTDPDRPKTYIQPEQTFSFAPTSSESSAAFCRIQ